MNRTIPVGASPRIILEAVGGDLSIVGWDGEDLLIKGDDDEARVEQEPGLVRINWQDDLSLRVPTGASLEIDTVHGDMALRGTQGHVELRSVVGDLSARDVNSLNIESVNGDFSLRGARGDLHVKKLNADVSVREVDGNVNLPSVADDLALRDVRGNINVNAGADVILYLKPRSDQVCNVTAGDDIMLVLPPKSDATLELAADDIDVQLAGVPQEEDVTHRVIVLGSGSARIQLKAGSDLRVSSEAAERGEEFGNFAGMEFDWSDFGEKISRRVQQATQRAARKVDQKMRGPRGQVGIGRWNWDIQPGSFPGGSILGTADPVTEEERMAILRMLEEKKITASEAEKLLAALEGGE